MGAVTDDRSGTRRRGIWATPTGDARTASVAVFITFFLSGFNFAGWAARLPAVRDALDFSPNEMGVLLLVAAIGSLLALPMSGVVVQWLGARRTVQVSAGLNTAGLLLASVGVALGSVWLTGIGLSIYGIGTGVWDAAMNLEGAAAEQLLGRSMMPRYHAGFSFGTVTGAGLGAGAAALDVPVIAHLGIALTVSFAVVMFATRHFLPEGTHDAHPDDARGVRGAAKAFNAWGESRTLLIGLVVLAAALTVFVTAMTGMRLLGTGLLDRWGRVLVLRLCAALSLVGLLVFALAPTLWLAAIGVVAWGMGAALGFPVGMSAAADDPRRAPARIAVVSTIGYSAFLAGPPLLGMLAEQVGYRHALLAILAPVVVGLFVMHAARPLPGTALAGVVPLDPAAAPGLAAAADRTGQPDHN